MSKRWNDTRAPEQKKADAEAKASEVGARLVDLLSNPEEAAKGLARVARNKLTGGAVPQHRWSLGNQLLAMLKDCEDGRTFAAWKSVGRAVKKGAKAFYILEPVRVQVPAKTSPNPEDKIWIMIGSRASARFRIQDTEIVDEALWARSNPSPKVRELPPLWEVAERMGIRVDYRGFRGDCWGFYMPGVERICLFTDHPGTFFHELAHAADGRANGPLRGGQDADQEIVAEATAAVLCAMFGVDCTEKSLQYLAHYTRDQQPVKAVIRLLGRIEKVLAEIFSHADPEEGIDAGEAA